MNQGILGLIKIRDINLKLGEREINVKIDKTIILSVIIMIFTLYLLTKKIANASFTKIPEIFYPCLELLSKGQLFQGEPFCAEGPFLFITGWLFQKTFGSYFQITLWVLTFLLFSYLVFLMYKISKKETGKYNIVLISFLIVLWLWGFVVEDKLEKAFATIFTFLGFYYLYYSNIKFKEIISSIFFAIAVFSSFNALAPIALCILFYPLKIGLIRWKNTRLTFSKVGFLRIFYLLLPFAVIYLILTLIWPNFLKYAFFSHYINPRLTYKEALLVLIPWGYVNLNILIAYSILLISLYVFRAYKNFIPVIGGVSFLVVLVGHHRGIGELVVDRMTAPTVPFIILTIILLKCLAENKDYTKVMFSMFMALLLIFPSFGPNPIGQAIYFKLNYSFENFKKEVGYGINLLPEQNGKILVQYKELLTDYDYEIKNPDNVFVVEGSKIKSSIYDGWNSPRLIQLLNIDEEKYDPIIEEINTNLLDKGSTAEQEKIVNETAELIAKSDFDFMIAGTKFGHPIISMIYRALNQLRTNNHPVESQYTEIQIPNVEMSHLQYAKVTGIPIKKQYLDVALKRMNEYYTLIFDDICKKSEYVANQFIKKLFSKRKQGTINKTCEKGLGKFIDRFNNVVLFSEHISLISFMMFVIMLIYAPFLIKRNNLTKKKEKIIYFGCMLTFLIISIIFLIKTLSLSDHYIEIAKQVKATYPY